MHRRYSFVRDSARYDVVEIGEVGIHIECKSVHRHPPTALHSKRCDFACFRSQLRVEPYTGKSFDTTRRNAIICQRENDGLFQIAEVFVDVGEVMVEIENRIAYNLPRAVIGDVAATIDGVEPCINLIQRLIIEEKIGQSPLLPSVYTWGCSTKNKWSVVTTCSSGAFARLSNFV